VVVVIADFNGTWSADFEWEGCVSSLTFVWPYIQILAYSLLLLVVFLPMIVPTPVYAKFNVDHLKIKGSQIAIIKVN